MPTNEYFEDLEGMSLKFLLVWLTLAIDLSTHNIIEKPLEIFLWTKNIWTVASVLCLAYKSQMWQLAIGFK